MVEWRGEGKEQTVLKGEDKTEKNVGKDEEKEENKCR